MTRDYTSFSEINLAARCGIQHALRYKEGIIIPPSTSLIKGTHYHSALDRNHRQKIETSTDLPLGELKEVYAAGVENAFKNEVLLKKDERDKGKGGTMDLTISGGYAALDVYFKNLAPNIQPLETEVKFKVPLGYELPDLLVVIDTITTEMKVIDYKTSAKTPPSTEAQNSIQFDAYALAFNAKYGFLPPEMELQYAVVTPKTQKASTVVLPTTRTEDHLENFRRRVYYIMDAIRKDVRVPPPQGDWSCGACGYRELNYCPLYKTKAIRAQEAFAAAGDEWF